MGGEGPQLLEVQGRTGHGFLSGAQALEWVEVWAGAVRAACCVAGSHWLGGQLTRRAGSHQQLEGQDRRHSSGAGLAGHLLGLGGLHWYRCAGVLVGAGTGLLYCLASLFRQLCLQH